MQETKEILLIDMDGVIVDLQREINMWFLRNPDKFSQYKDSPDKIPGIFRNPQPIKGSIEAIKKLHESGKYEMVIATTSPWDVPEANTDKRYWIERYFKGIFTKNMIITHRKDLLIGKYLIDDRLTNGASEFKGTLLRFGIDYETGKWNKYVTWSKILKKLL